MVHNLHPSFLSVEHLLCSMLYPWASNKTIGKIHKDCLEWLASWKSGLETKGEGLMYSYVRRKHGL